MGKTTLSLVFTVGFLFLCSQQLFAVEEDESSWIDFFSLFPSEEPSKIDAARDYDTDSITEKPVVKGESLVKPEPPDPEVFHKDIIEVPPQSSVAKEESLVGPPPLVPGTLT